MAGQESPASTLPSTNLPATFMKEITSDFSANQEVGRSVFGTVYKGVLPDGGVLAVKRLAENAPVAPGTTFDNEVANLMALKHDNIVQLIGFCREPQKKVIQHNGRYVIVDMIESCLCYEYLPNGSLDKHIYDNSSMDWDTRFRIIKGICLGLRFLHKELDAPLIHMNLVPNSIWLDDKYVPKIVDFGLSKIFGQEQTRMYTFTVKGHNGYMAPEYLYKGEISTMSDIYSLGMIIIEITTREKNCAVSDSDRSAREFVNNVHQNWKEHEQIISKYPLLDPNGLQQVKACIAIGLKCVEADRKRRASIVDIVDRLNGKRVPIFDQPNRLPNLLTEKRRDRDREETDTGERRFGPHALSHSLVARRLATRRPHPTPGVEGFAGGRTLGRSAATSTHQLRLPDLVSPRAGDPSDPPAPYHLLPPPARSGPGSAKSCDEPGGRAKVCCSSYGGRREQTRCSSSLIDGRRHEGTRPLLRHQQQGQVGAGAWGKGNRPRAASGYEDWGHPIESGLRSFDKLLQIRN